MYDMIIRGGTIVDGSGAAPYVGDIAVCDGMIVEVGGTIAADALEIVDATGLLVTPGWVDVHTHYDGQVTWDEALEPSATNGVTTVVMGNCGVGFAPVRPSDHDDLMALMEGVEDIPGSALAVGMPWGTWETFGEYLDLLDAREYSIDIAAQVAHGAVRFYAMGARGAANEDATADDIEAMAAIVTEALEAGAVGFSTSRTAGHRSRTGHPVPGTYAALDELVAIGNAMRAVGHGVFEAIMAGTIGTLGGVGDTTKLVDEIPVLEAVAHASGRPVTFSVAQLFEDPEHWRTVLHATADANARGVDLRPQIQPRSVTIMTSLDAYHVFQARPSYRAIAHLPLAERVAEMRKPDVRAAILTERNISMRGLDFSETVVHLFAGALALTFPLTDPIDYEPRFDQSVLAQATAAGIDPFEHMYDLLLADEGRAFYAVLGSNFVNGSLDVCREMLLAPNSVTGLGDAGAHVKFISDCSASTFHLTHWARDRQRGDTLPLELMVHKLSGANAALYGFDDRGTIEVGKRADLNIIDFEALRICPPVVRHDLPTGASRILQPAEGYVATFVNGTAIRRDGIDTGHRPGRLVRAGRSHPAA